VQYKALLRKRDGSIAEITPYRVDKITRNATVLDLVSQVRDVVLMKCIFGSGRPQGVGILE
jgi:hypothetical protein